MRLSEKICASAFFLVSLIALAIPASALTPIPPVFYGAATIDGLPAPIGTNVTMQTTEGRVCGMQTITTQGEFGTISCNGDDPETEIVEGPKNGQTVIILLNRLTAGNVTWQEAGLSRIELEAFSASADRKLLNLESTRMPSLYLIIGAGLLLAISTFIYVRRGATL